MTWVFVLLGAIAALLIVCVKALEARISAKRARGEVRLQYELAGPLLSEAEAKFYGVLREAALAGPEACVVACKVRLRDVIQPLRGLDRSRWQTLHNRACQKHLDFVVVRASDFGVLAAVELDDASHQRRDRRERDAFVDAAMSAAGVRVLRVRCRSGYVLEEVARALWENGTGGQAQGEPGSAVNVARSRSGG